MGLCGRSDFSTGRTPPVANDIQKYNSILLGIIDGLDDRLDKIRADVLQTQPFPTGEQAYAQAMFSNGGQKSQQQLSFQAPLTERPNTRIKPKSQGEGGSCTLCGNAKHTKETCFKLYGYPAEGKEKMVKLIPTGFPFTI